MSGDSEEESTPPSPETPRFILWLGQAWLILGITLFVLLLLEFGYRGQAAAKRALGFGPEWAGMDSSLHPYADESWWDGYLAEIAGRRWHLDDYRGFWPYPQNGRYVNTDSNGYRTTPQPEAEGPIRQVRFFGGSAMWGTAVRDSFTVPSLVARRLHEEGFTGVVVENRAQPGFTVTQSLATLSLDLARKDVPGVAVFLDGYNDIMTARGHGEPGHTYTEDHAQGLVDRGKRSGWETLVGLSEHSALVRRIQQGLGLKNDQDRERADPDEICGPVAGYYRGVVDVIAGLGEQFGFPVLFFQQPVHASSEKRLTGWESQ
ncbi:MAG: hypothetical protein ACREL6_01290, partial [Gemmatimonadales bacterium]